MSSDFDQAIKNADLLTSIFLSGIYEEKKKLAENMHGSTKNLDSAYRIFSGFVTDAVEDYVNDLKGIQNDHLR